MWLEQIGKVPRDEIEDNGRDQIIQGLVGHGKEFIFYS